MTGTYQLVKDELAHYNSLRGPFAKYRRDPVRYAEEILGVHWWSKQIEVARALLQHQRVFVKASHSVGKTHLAGGLVSWHFDSFEPSITKTTAPTKNQVCELTWKEVRAQRRGREMYPIAPRIQKVRPNGDIDPEHYAAGYTARDADAFQGTHERRLFIIFEEAVGVAAPFWTAADGMLSSGEGNIWLAIMNPTSTASAAYQQEMMGGWHVITISALDHPNVAAELRHLPRPFPKALSLQWVEEQMQKHCREVPAKEKRPGDFPWPPLEFCEERGIEPKWYRPDSDFEGRVLGRWPSQASDSIWSEALWDSVTTKRPELWAESKKHPPELGCDRARFGDDTTSMHGRRGPVSLLHESHQGFDTSQTIARLKELCGILGRRCGVDRKKVLVKVDDFGGGVVDPMRRDGWNFVEVNAASSPFEPEHYKNRRSELWFGVADRAFEGRIDLSALPPAVLAEIRRQCMAPKWAPDSQGRKVVEEKKVTKKNIKRSPDDADAMNLAYAPPPPNTTSGLGPKRKQQPSPIRVF